MLAARIETRRKIFSVVICETDSKLTGFAYTDADCFFV